jgi:hypothetical protein
VCFEETDRKCLQYVETCWVIGQGVFLLPIRWKIWWEMFATVPDSNINSWESWFIFNLQYYKSDTLNVRDCSILQEYTTLQDIEHIIITVHTWTAIFLKRLANTSFMALFQAWTEPHSGLSLRACIMLPCPTQYLAVYYSGSGFTPNALLQSGWLLTNVQVNNITRTTYVHTCIYITLVLLFFFLHIFHSSWQAG